MKIFGRLYASRGATCCENTVESIAERVPALYAEILRKNGIKERNIVSVVFSVTADLTTLNPATALRRAGLGNDVPLFSCAEPFIEGYLPKVIRVLVTYYGSGKPFHVYHNGAEALRPDLAAGTGSGTAAP